MISKNDIFYILKIAAAVVLGNYVYDMLGARGLLGRRTTV